MSGSDSRVRTTALDERELDEIAAELYALRPEVFAAARDDQVRKARAEGRQQLARGLSQLRRPTQSAWLVNLLWRNQHDATEELLQLADDLGRAQAEASSLELHRLTALRRQLESTLLRQARTLAEKAGGNVTATMEREVQETLAAALVSADVANEVRSGRLVKPASYAGFGPPLSAVPFAGAHRHEPQDTETGVAGSSRQRKKPDDLEERAAQRTRTRPEDSKRRIQEARAALEGAAGALADRRRAADAAQQHHLEARKRADHLREQLSLLEDEVAAAERAALAATQRRDEAEKEHEEALRTLERAEQELKE